MRTKKPRYCMLRDNEGLAKQLNINSGNNVTRALKKLMALDEDIFDRAAARVRALGGDAAVERVLSRRRNAAIQRSLPKKSATASSLAAGGRSGASGRSAASVRSGRALSKSSVSTAAWRGVVRRERAEAPSARCVCGIV